MRIGNALKVGCIGIAVLLAGCGPAEHGARSTAVESRVRDALKDPDSAKVSITDDFPMFDSRIVCGTVNAKNSFGGYAGDRAFRVSVNADGTVTPPDIASDETFSRMNDATCQWLKEYAAMHGSDGAPATSEQVKAMSAEYEKFVTAIAREITARR